MLLVDGYNLIFNLRQQSGMREFTDSSVLEEFRSELLRNITEFSHFRGFNPPPPLMVLF